MITGEHAVPQPPSHPTSVDARAREARVAVLKREALLRSFRWFFIIHWANSLAAMAIQSATMSELAELLDLDQWVLPFYSILALISTAVCLAGYVALRNPQPESRKTLVLIVLLSLIFQVFAWVLLFSARGSDWSAKIFDFWLSAPYVLILLALLPLTHGRVGNMVYSPQGYEYFSHERSERYAENPWIGLAYGSYIALIWGYFWMIG